MSSSQSQDEVELSEGRLVYISHGVNKELPAEILNDTIVKMRITSGRYQVRGGK